MKSLIFQLEESPGHVFYHHIQFVKKFLYMKNNKLTFRRGSICSNLSQVSQSLLLYTKEDIKHLKHTLWHEHLSLCADKKSKAVFKSCDTYSPLKTFCFSLSASKYLFPRTSRRETDTKIMTLLHGHDKNFRSFQHKLGLIESPLCTLCTQKEDNNIHQVLECPRFSCKFRDELLQVTDKALNLVQGILTCANKEQIQCFRNMAQIVIKLNVKPRCPPT